jgi:endonuclease YncB( thermonuclease family)
MQLEDLNYKNCVKPMVSFPEGKAKVVKVYDGDTCTLAKIDPNNKEQGIRYSSRIYGIDTAEKRTRDPFEKKAANYSQQILSDLIIDKVVNVQVLNMDKYGRLLVKLSSEQIPDISDYMLEHGLAYSYDGGTKQDINWQEKLSKVTMEKEC